MITLPVCTELDSMISAGSPPDLVLDFSLIGRTSEVMKQISRDLGLPTVTSAIGEEREIWSWDALSAAQQDYLVQVRSPADILPSIVTDLANITDMDNAAVIYDDTFSKLSSERMISSNFISFSRHEETFQKSVLKSPNQT